MKCSIVITKASARLSLCSQLFFAAVEHHYLIFYPPASIKPVMLGRDDFKGNRPGNWRANLRTAADNVGLETACNPHAVCRHRGDVAAKAACSITKRGDAASLSDWIYGSQLGELNDTRSPEQRPSGSPFRYGPENGAIVFSGRDHCKL